MIVNLELIDENTINMKLQKIKELIQGKKIIVAFSGGVDSSVLAHLCKEFANNVLLVMQVGYSVGIGEKEYARNQAKQLRLPIEFIEYEEIDYSSDFSANPSNRCYYCKDLLFEFLEKIKIEQGFDTIVCGTNASDLEGHRPGYQASLDAGVLNPLVIADISKQEVRWIARNAGLISWNKVATACLASRFPTGVKITTEELQRVAKAEYYLRNKYNISILRVRNHHKFARIEIANDEMYKVMDKDTIQEINLELKQLGYDYVTLDLEGYRPATP